MYVYRKNIHLPRKKTIVINRLQVHIKKYCNVPLCLSTCTYSVHVHLYMNFDRKWSWNASHEHEVDAKWLWHCTAQAFSEHHTCHMHTNKPEPKDSRVEGKIRRKQSTSHEITPPNAYIFMGIAFSRMRRRQFSVTDAIIGQLALLLFLLFAHARLLTQITFLQLWN